jgi:hypothetical protein
VSRGAQLVTFSASCNAARACVGWSRSDGKQLMTLSAWRGSRVQTRRCRVAMPIANAM